MPDVAEGVIGDCLPIEVGVPGSGSNLLVADPGVRGRALILDQQLSQIAVPGTRPPGGGGRRMPAGQPDAAARIAAARHAVAQAAAARTAVGPLGADGKPR